MTFDKLYTDPRLAEFFRFCVVGVICTLLDAAIFYLVINWTPYEVALVSGYCISLIVNYLLTVTWTFKQKATKKNAVGVIAAHLINLFIVRMGLMHIFVAMGLTDRQAYIPTLLISMVTNFVLVRYAVKKFS